MLYKDRAKQDLVSVLNKIQQAYITEKRIKPIVLEDYAERIIENIIKEIMLRLKHKI
jgi:hypothetical protein